MAKYCVLYNPRPGGENSAKDIRAAFAARNLEADLIELNKNWQAVAKNKIKEGCQIFIAAGGDGTVNAAANLVQGTDLKLAVLPIGTFNHFAKDLGLPLDIEAAVDAITKGKVMKVDIASVNNRFFVNNSTVGLYPQLVKQRTERSHHFSQLLSSAKATAKVLINLKTYRLELAVDDKPAKAVRASFIFISNNGYKISQTGFTNRSDLSEGKLGLYIVRSSRSLKIIKLFIQVLAGRISHKDGLHHQKAKKIKLSFRAKRVDMSLDGELQQLNSPLTYEIHPKHLTVIIPA